MSISNWDPVAFSLGPIAIRWYGILMALSVAIGFYHLLKGARRRGYKDDFAYDLITIAVIGGIIGARLVFVATNWPYFSSFPSLIFRVDLGGLSFHGGVIGGMIAAWPYVRRHQVKLSAMADLAVPGLAVGIALVRWGNLVNHEVMGRITASGFQHPAQLYGSLVGLVLLIIHNVLVRRPHPPGFLFWTFALYYSVLRGLFEETFRANPLYAVGAVFDEWGAGFFTLTQLLTPLFVGIAWYMRSRLGREVVQSNAGAPPEAGRTKQL